MTCQRKPYNSLNLCKHAQREAIEPFCTVDDTFLDFPAIATAMDDILGEAIALK